MKILVVDDDKYMLDLVASILKKYDMDVVSRSNVGDAIRDLPEAVLIACSSTCTCPAWTLFRLYR